MTNAAILVVAMLFLMDDAMFADIVVRHEVLSYETGSTKLKLCGKLNDAAMEALSNGESIAIQNNLTSYLCVPVLLDASKKGFGKKSDVRKIFLSTKNGKLAWTEKDVAKNFSFAVGNERIEPSKAVLISSGTLKTKDFSGFLTKQATLFDILCNEQGLSCVAGCFFFPEKKGKNYKYSSQEQDVQVKFTANSKGKANISYKLSPKAVSPALVSEFNDDPIHPIDPPDPPDPQDPQDPEDPPVVVTGGVYMVIDLSGGPDAEKYPVSYIEGAPSGGWTEEYKTTKMVLRKIEAGTFTMGSPSDELGRSDDEVLHEVKLTKNYYVGVFEVTQKQYKLITGEDPSDYKGDARPVEKVSYEMIRGSRVGGGWPPNNDVDEDSFFGKLRAKTKMKFDLPTEAQWEYACRAGTVTALNDGHDLTNEWEDANLNKLGRYGANHTDHRGGYDYYEHTVVGSYWPNAWGLYDMHGNVYEWCLDCYASYKNDFEDPTGPVRANNRVLRGGSFYYSYWHAKLPASICRSAARDKREYPSHKSDDCGFRVAFTEPEPLDSGTYMVIDLSGGPNAGKYPISYRNGVPDGGWTDEHRTKKMILRRVNAGEFVMGSPYGELGKSSDETPHMVTLTKDFFIGVFEITQEQYKLITGSNPSDSYGETRPVESVSLSEIFDFEGKNTTFLSILCSKTDLAFELPTEAQWEYACRAGTTTALNDGNNLTNTWEDGHLNKLGRYYCNQLDGSGGCSSHTRVGSYRPNAWGLYDMHGNVKEWCLDWYESDLGSDPVIDPLVTREYFNYHVIKGGSMGNGANECRSANRSSENINSGSKYLGFRIILNIDNEQTD